MAIKNTYRDSNKYTFVYNETDIKGILLDNNISYGYTIISDNKPKFINDKLVSIIFNDIMFVGVGNNLYWSTVTAHGVMVLGHYDDRYILLDDDIVGLHKINNDILLVVTKSYVELFNVTQYSGEIVLIAQNRMPYWAKSPYHIADNGSGLVFVLNTNGIFILTIQGANEIGYNIKDILVDIDNLRLYYIAEGPYLIVLKKHIKTKNVVDLTIVDPDYKDKSGGGIGGKEGGIGGKEGGIGGKGGGIGGKEGGDRPPIIDIEPKTKNYNINSIDVDEKPRDNDTNNPIDIDVINKILKNNQIYEQGDIMYIYDLTYRSWSKFIENEPPYISYSTGLNENMLYKRITNYYENDLVINKPLLNQQPSKIINFSIYPKKGRKYINKFSIDVETYKG